MQSFAQFLPLILIVVVFYFMLIRPQNKQRKEMQNMRDNMKPGDEIITIGGFYGIIYAIDDENIVLEMLPDFHKAMIVKSAVSKVIVKDEEDAEEIEETATSAEEETEAQAYNDNPVEDAEFEEVSDATEVGEEKTEN
ncbi:MAG: preprotein translocase subunit YajC [Eubacterium sp.]|nr:preprotein translocase subunit YajC [Eubacterium sp.]